MVCPKCRVTDMTIVMEEVLGTWYKCPECHYEHISPVPRERRNMNQRPFPIDGFYRAT